MPPEATQDEVTPAEEIQEQGSPQDAGESGKVAEPDNSSLQEEIERLKKSARDFQAEKDRLQAELKKRDRADMDEVERLKAEMEDLEAQRVSSEALATHWYVENLKKDLIGEFNLPAKFAKFLHGSDEEDLRKNARELAELVGDLGVRAATQQAEEDERQRQEEAPDVTGGSGITPEIDKEYAELRKEATDSRDYKGLIQHILGKKK